MSEPDYSVCAEDHRTLLVLVKQIGSDLNQKTFNKIYDKINRIQHIEIQDSGGVRFVKLKYKKTYSTENNEWGDFQTYRKVLGILSIGKWNVESDVEGLCNEHNKLQEKYNNSVFDSRCLAFGSECSSPPELGESKLTIEESNLLSPECTQSPVLENGQSDVFMDNVEPVPKSHINSESELILFERRNQSDQITVESTECSNFVEGSNSSKELNSLPNVTIFENSHVNENCNESEKEVSSNSFDSSNESSSNSPITDDNSPLTSRKYIIPSTLNSRSTHCIIYPGVDNCDQLEHDIKEFINSLFWVLESKRLDRSYEKQDKVSLLTAAFEKKNFVGIDTDTRVYKKRCLGRMKKHIGDLAMQAGLPLEALLLYASSIDLLKAANDFLWLASAYEGQCSASIVLLYPSQNRNLPLQRISSYPIGIHNKSKSSLLSNSSKSLPSNVEPVEYKNLGKVILTLEEIVEKYQDALLNYAKYQGAIVVEIECSIKAAKVLAMQEKWLESSEFLKNVVFTSLPQSDEEKVHRFNALAQLYTEIGFHRKASFFKRIAATRCVAKSNPDPNWTQCYYLLLEALDGFKLSLDTKEFPKDITYGWPSIQVEILRDLVGIARHKNNQALAVRHMTFLLHSLLTHLSSSEQQEFCFQLEQLTAKCEGAPVSLTLENGLVIPPVNLLNLPRVNTFKLQNLAPHLRPVKIASAGSKLEPDPRESIFIFSPIPRNNKLSRDSNKLDFKWVEGDVCEVTLQVFNPLPFELKVTHMGLQADGIAFESFPACLSLPAASGPYPVNLLGTPVSSGELQILGYTTHVLGVKSNCRLRDIPAIKKPFFAIDVIPRLPQIQVTTSLPKASTFSSLGDTSYVVVSAAVTMYSGESQECTVTLSNISKDAVERVDLSLHTKLNRDKETAFFTWSKENLETQLPIAPGASASFTLYVNALGDFVNPMKTSKDASDSSQAATKGSRSSSMSSVGGTPNKRKPPTIVSPEPFPPKIVEAVLQIQYTGGKGMLSNYCRQCAVALTVEVLSSIVVTKWDVLPSELPTHCYLVLDILNSTAHEMELQYTSNKRILIEAHDVCRIPVSVERCPLSSLPVKNCCSKTPSESLSSQRKLKLLASCRDHLVNLVDLQWTLSVLEITGRASISEITWTDAMLDFILMSPIQWDISLNGKPFKQEDELCFIVGDLITLGIKLHNISDISLHSLHLYIRGFQDHQNGQKSFRLETKRAVIGSDKVFIWEILPQEEYIHECGFVFFHTGVYKLDILCNHEEQGNWLKNVMTNSDSSNSVLEKNYVSFPSSWNSDQSCHLQKCAPSIDITILED